MKNLFKKLTLALALIGAMQPLTTQAIPAWLSYDKLAETARTVTQAATEQYQNLNTNDINAIKIGAAAGAVFALGYTYPNARSKIVNISLDLVKGVGALTIGTANLTGNGIAYLYNELRTKPKIKADIGALNWNNPEGLFDEPKEENKVRKLSDSIVNTILTQEYLNLLKAIQEIFVIVDPNLKSFCNSVVRTYPKTNTSISMPQIEVELKTETNVINGGKINFDMTKFKLLNALQNNSNSLKLKKYNQCPLKQTLVNEIEWRIEIAQKILDHPKYRFNTTVIAMQELLSAAGAIITAGVSGVTIHA